MKYYALNLGDFAALTQGLSTIEIGIIVRIRHMVLSEEKPVPVTRLALVLRDVPRETLQAVLDTFFVETADGWTAPDLEQMIEDFHDLAERKRQAGVASGKKRSAAKDDRQRQKVAEQSFNMCSSGCSTKTNDRSTCVHQVFNENERPFNTCSSGVQQKRTTVQHVSDKVLNRNQQLFTTINHKPKTINHKPENKGGVGESPQADPPPADASPSSALIPLEEEKTAAGSSLPALNSLPDEDRERVEEDIAAAGSSASALNSCAGCSPIPGATMTAGPAAPIAPRPEVEPQDAGAGEVDLSSSEPPAKPKRRSKPKIELPFSTLPDEWRKIGEAIDPDLDYRKVFDEFREYWLSEGGPKRDWTRVWRNRVHDVQSYPNLKLRYARDPLATPRRQMEELATADARGEFSWAPPPVGKPAPEPQDDKVLEALDNLMSGFSIQERRAA